MPLVVGRDGWQFQSDPAEALLRVDLTEADGFGPPRGLIVFTCGPAGYRMVFSLDGGSRRQLPSAQADGFVHFVPRGEGGSPEEKSVSIYVRFNQPTSFRSVPTASSSDRPVEELLSLLLGPVDQMEVVLKPRIESGSFTRDLRLRLAMGEQQSADAMPRGDAIPRFLLDCRRR